MDEQRDYDKSQFKQLWWPKHSSPSSLPLRLAVHAGGAVKDSGQGMANLETEEDISGPVNSCGCKSQSKYQSQHYLLSVCL